MARIGLGVAFALIVAGAAHAQDRTVPARTLQTKRVHRSACTPVR
jgi:hypothetical protein